MNRKILAIAVLFTALFVIAIGATWTVAQSDGVIHACVKDNGDVRTVDSDLDCKPEKVTHIFCNIVGEQGEKGDPGPPGPSVMPHATMSTGWLPCDNEVYSFGYPWKADDDNFLVEVQVRLAHQYWEHIYIVDPHEPLVSWTVRIDDEDHPYAHRIARAPGAAVVHHN